MEEKELHMIIIKLTYIKRLALEAVEANNIGKQQIKSCDSLYKKGLVAKRYYEEDKSDMVYGITELGSAVLKYWRSKIII